MLKKLVTEVLTIPEIKALYLETLLNFTSKVSKISALAVLNGHAFGIAKLFQKDMKDTAVLESQIFPELSSGSYLDSAARLVGGLNRLSAAGSSTYVLVYAEEGTSYFPGDSVFVSTKGVNFSISDVIVVGKENYAYVPVRSVSVGVNTNVDALTINKIINPPTGHLSCTNEYSAIGGRDEERDEEFKERVSTFRQFAAKTTFEHLIEALRLSDPNIIKVFKAGYDNGGKQLLSIVNSAGRYYTGEELQNMGEDLKKYLSISETNEQENITTVKLINAVWGEIGGKGGIDFRVDIEAGYNEQAVRRDIQIQLTKYFDFKYWTGIRIEADDLLEIVKNVRGVKYVPDEYFFPASDHLIDKGSLPRIVRFVMRDMDGVILYDGNRSILPIYYSI